MGYGSSDCNGCDKYGASWCHECYDKGKRLCNADEAVAAERKRCSYIVIAQHHKWINDRRYDASEMVSRILAEIEKGE